MTGVINTIYRIERMATSGENPSIVWITVMSGPMTNEEAHRKYDAYRNNRPSDEYRLVMVTDYVQRYGKGKVFE